MWIWWLLTVIRFFYIFFFILILKNPIYSFGAFILNLDSFFFKLKVSFSTLLKVVYSYLQSNETFLYNTFDEKRYKKPRNRQCQGLSVYEPMINWFFQSLGQFWHHQVGLKALFISAPCQFVTWLTRHLKVQRFTRHLLATLEFVKWSFKKILMVDLNHHCQRWKYS